MAIEAPVGSAPARRMSLARLVASVRVEHLILFGVLIGGLAIRLYYDFGLVKVDPFTYADAAGSLVKGEPIYDSEITGSVYFTQYVRLSLIAPAALLYALFGPSDAASVAWPVGLSLGMAALAYAAGRMLSGGVAGLIAAALVCFFPLNVINSTQFLPDIVVAAFSGLAIVCFVRAEEFPATPRQRFWLFVAVGASVALACYARATAVTLIPAMALLLAWRRSLAWELTGIALGGLAILAGAEALLLAYGADLFEDLRVIRTESETEFHFRLNYARIFLTDRTFWPFFTFAGVGLALLLWRRGFSALVRSPIFPLLVFVAVQYVYLEFIMSLPGVVTWWKEPRYALPLVFPVLLVGSVGWAEGMSPLLAHRRTAAWACIAVGCLLLVAAAIPPVADEFSYYKDEGNRVDLDALTIARLVPDDASVYVHDDDFARPLSFRLGIAGTLYERAVSDSGRLHQRLDPQGRSAVQPGSYVVTLPRESWWALPTAPSPDWELVWTGKSGVTLHRVPGPASNPGATASASTLHVFQAEGPLGANGWRTITGPNLSFGAGVVGVPGSSATIHFPAISARDYWVELLVIDYGKGTNRVMVDLNGSTGAIAWGAEDGSTPRVTSARILLRSVAAGGELYLTVAEVGQEAVVIDAIAVTDREPPR